MIVRISGEGQFEMPADLLDRLNELDNAAVAAVEAGDEPTFHETYDAMLALVRDNGRVLADDELVESEVILPPVDLGFDEAGEQFTGDGLIPD